MCENLAIHMENKNSFIQGRGRVGGEGKGVI